jgi:hypothetical protein
MNFNMTMPSFRSVLCHFLFQPSRHRPVPAGAPRAPHGPGRGTIGHPEAWAIVDGKLYLNSDKAGRDEWRQDPAADITVGSLTAGSAAVASPDIA